MNTVRTRRTQGIHAAAMVLVALGAMTLARPAAAIERSLAGIRIFSGQSAILKKYGSPSQIIVGRPSLMPTGTAGANGTNPGANGAMPGAPSPGGLPGFGGGAPSFGGGSPGVPSEFGGGGGSAPSGGLGLPPSSAAGAAGADPSNGEVTWIYERPGGSDLEFTLSSDGRVVQIRATGYKNASVKTSKGTMLGQNYGAVVGKYGYPETQEQSGPILTARYTERVHAAFQFYNQRLVAIIVAAVE